MDVDFGINVGASGGQYGAIKSDLDGLGFKSEGNRLVRKVADLNLYLDFLTEDPPAMTGNRVVDDVVASVIPGVNRAPPPDVWSQCKDATSWRGTEVLGCGQRHAARCWF